MPTNRHTGRRRRGGDDLGNTTQRILANTKDTTSDPSTQRELITLARKSTRSQHNPTGARVTGIESPDDKTVLSVLRSPSRGEGVMLRRIRPQARIG